MIQIQNPNSDYKTVELIETSLTDEKNKFLNKVFILI